MLSEKFVYSLLNQAGVLQDDTLVLQFIEENNFSINSVINKENLLLTIMASYFIEKKRVPETIKKYIDLNIHFLSPEMLLKEHSSGLKLLSLLLSLNSKTINNFLKPYINKNVKNELLKVIEDNSLAKIIISDKQALNTLDFLNDCGIKIFFLDGFHFFKHIENEKTGLWLLEKGWVDYIAQDKDDKTIYYYISLLKTPVVEKIYKNLNKKFTEENKEAEHNALLVYTFSHSRKLSLFKKFVKKKNFADINYNGENILSNYINARLIQNKSIDSHNTFRFDSAKSNYILKRIEENQEENYLDSKNEWSAHYLLFKHSYLKSFEENICNSIKDPDDFHHLINNMTTILNKNFENKNLDKAVKLSYILSFIELDIVGLCLGLIYRSQNVKEQNVRYNYNSIAKDIIKNEDFYAVFTMLMNVSKNYYIIMKDPTVSRKNMSYRRKFENLLKIPYDFKDYIEEDEFLREGLYYLYYNFIHNTIDRYSESTHSLFDIMKIPEDISVEEIDDLKKKIKGDSPQIRSTLEEYMIVKNLGDSEFGSSKKKRL